MNQANPANSVVFLQLRRDETLLAVGSGVLYERSEKTYIVTAWHNVTGRHTESLKCLSDKTQATPNNVVATIACSTYSDGEYAGHISRSITIPLESDSRATYYVHAQGWPRIDVVAIPIDPKKVYISEGQEASGEEYNYSLPLTMSASQSGALSTGIEPIQASETSTAYIELDLPKYLAASDDIFVLGYPKGITDYTNQPVWKRATVASSPQLGWNGQPKFLIDCASREGMSGAPAIYFNRKGSVHVENKTFITSGPATILHEIYVGRLGITSEFEAQLGTVWKRSVIDEIIDGAIFGPVSEEITVSQSTVLQTIEALWPKTESYAEAILDEKSYFINIFTHSVMKSINGRANPDKVSELVRLHAHKLLEKRV